MVTIGTVATNGTLFLVNRRWPYVPKVLNVHVNESKKKLLFLEDFFSSSKKLTFEKEHVILILI